MDMQKRILIGCVASLCIVGITLSVAITRAGIRMKDDPKVSHFRVKLKDLENGTVKWIEGDPDEPYEPGDIYLIEKKDSDDDIIALGPKVLVLEVRELDDDGNVIYKKK